MKPLVYYCRWQQRALRLRGRDTTAVWGQLVQTDADGREQTQTFHYYLHERRLVLQTEDGEQTQWLDEMGTVVSPPPSLAG